MRNWGVPITAFYILVVAILSQATIIFLFPEAEIDLAEFYFEWGSLLWLAILVAGPLVLLLTRVDRTHKALPQRKKSAAVVAIAFAVALLSAAAVMSVMAAIHGDELFEMLESVFATIGIGEPDFGDSPSLFYGWTILLPLLGFWLLWGVIFWRFSGRILDREKRIYQWLIGGSVLELLIAVPSNVIVQQREECSAPMVTAYGVSTGIALLFMSFGPAILWLYRERMRLSPKTPPAADDPAIE